MRLILLKNPSDQKDTAKRTISDVSLDHSNRVQTRLARKNFRHFSRIFAHRPKEGVLQQNRECHVSTEQVFASVNSSRLLNLKRIREGVVPTECHVSAACGSPQRARWLLISLSPGLHELRRANDRALSPALGWKVGQVARNEMIRLPCQSDTAHHLHFQWRGRRAAAISA